MRALYDSEAHAIWIDVVDPPAETGAGADTDTYPILSHYDADDVLIAIEMLYADTLAEAEVVQALSGLPLDIPTLLAAWRAGLAAPDREVVVGPAIPAQPPVAIDRIAWFSDLVAEDPDEPRARYGLAVALRQAERWDDAVPQYRAYLDLATDEGAAYGHLAECLAATGDVDAAADAYLAGIDAALAHGHTGLADDFREALEALG